MYKVCKQCHKGFEASRGTKLYCSPECYRLAKKKIDRDRDRIKRGVPLDKRECPICHRSFDITQRAKKYCSVECARIGKEQHRKRPGAE